MSADAWKTIALGQRASISFSGVDKHIVPGETKIRLCNYLDVYRNRHLRSSIVYSPGSAKDVEIRRFQLQRGDILITKDSETPDDIGIPAVVVDDLPNTICGYHLALIRPNSGLNSSFLGQYLQGEQAKKHFLCYAAGATRFGLNLRAISSLPIPDIDIDEQSSVACILDAVDSAIEHTRTATEQAKLLSRSLVRDLLECGVDETGALRSKEISTNRFNATEIGLLPESWVVQKLSDVADVERGRFSPRPRNDPRFYNGAIPVCTNRTDRESERSSDNRLLPNFEYSRQGSES
jgi:type I restriction enzyme, S subunit